MLDFEKLGSFYLGKIFDPASQKVTEDLLLYESKNLTTHAVCIGMTGSGKTGLGIDILEEAGLDHIPAIIVDPKGDLGNLLLTFPDLTPDEFRPWIDPAEAERQGMTTENYAENVAKTWKEGLAKWGEDAERIRKLRKSVEMVIYTPASNAGRPISILSSFEAPSKETLEDTTAMRDRVMSTTSSLLGLLGINADPIKNREHILISTIIEKAWRQGENVDIAGLIQEVQNPPFHKIGALDIDTVFPPKDRTALAISLNNLLASPGFQAWMEGDPLDVQQLLYTAEGKPKLSVISIAHLSDTERMFFVTLLLNQILAWMRRQPGTSSLRALFYMDEIFGYFPPTAMPPSKTPLLTLLKQARAFGLGVVLATQNPVDLDYKGLSNCGTWFIGRLQTDRDKARVIEGLNAAANGEMSSTKLDKMIASMGNRVFMLRSIYLKEPVLFQTRWTLSYLRGPLTLAQIEKLTLKKTTPARQAAIKISSLDGASSNSKPSVPPGINQFYFFSPNGQNPQCKPLVAGRAKLHYVDTKANLDTWEDVCLVAPPDENGKAVKWHEGVDLQEIKGNLREQPQAGSTFEELPPGLMQAKNYPLLAKDFGSWLYQNRTLATFQYKPLNLNSKENENESDFRQRVALSLREKRNETAKQLRESYNQKIATLTARLKRAQDKTSQQQQQAGMQKAQAWISVGTTILGAIFGRGVTKGTINQAGTSMRRIGNVGKESQQAQRAEEDAEAIQQQLHDLQSQLDHEISQIPLGSDPQSIQIDSFQISPRKSDISVTEIALVWAPVAAPSPKGEGF